MQPHLAEHLWAPAALHLTGPGAQDVLITSGEDSANAATIVVRRNPAPPKAHAPPLDIVDRAFIAALKQVGVPVPSHEYVMIHGHALTD